jgi:hypothetical protein
VSKVPKIIGQGQRQFRSEKGLMVLGVDLPDAREEIFVRMVCDGIAIGIAFVRAGFTSKNANTPAKIWALPRCQERARAILDARATTGVVTLPEVTDMLKRVFTGAYNGEEYSAAHNAAFSLARLYGHVTDRQTLEVVRRPSRDPDAPSEMALGDWVAGLPALNGPGPSVSGPLRGAPAEPLGLEPNSPNDISSLEAMNQGPGLGPEGPGPDLSNDIKGLGLGARGRPENGAPTGPVTVTPQRGARSELLGGGPFDLLGNEGTRPPGGVEKGAPLQGVEGTYPKWEDLF